MFFGSIVPHEAGENLEDGFGLGYTLLLAGFVQAEVHKEGRGVLKAVAIHHLVAGKILD